EVLGSFNKADYVTERVYATAKDGAKVPVSIVYKKGTKKDGSAPLLLYAYGSYGASMDASFSSNRLSLLNRGFIYAIAHIRGGQEMGRQWYEDGKLMKKKNTFTDFIDCGEFLIKEKYTSKGHLYAMGGSAGGLLMGAVVNMAPDLWNGVVAQVPFVDVITTMSDPTIPLTTNEYDEWGNPADKDAYFYMKSYSPYDNLEKKNYPNMLVTTGLHDSQVQYFEPAKWVARLRVLKTDKNLLLLKTNMEAGHGGASGRFDYLKEIAMEYAFLMALEGITS
ncbi:MAG: prolyl oligopeptidase family serine peptidase, partial [Chitinophagaceae bacterium]